MSLGIVMPSNRSSKCGDAVRFLLRSPSPHKLHEEYDDINVFLDFEHCLPKESEKELYDQLEELLSSIWVVIQDISAYGKGASDDVRDALQNSDNLKIQSKSFEKVKNLALKISTYYSLSKTIEEVIPELLSQLVCGPLSPAEQLDSKQALCKQFARLIDFMFRFDFVKMSTPALQNDFSFYRRVISHSDLGRDEIIVSLEEANTISLFLANATPMLNTLVQSTTKFMEAHQELPSSSTAETLVAVVYICRNMLERSDYVQRLSEINRMFFLRVMVGSLVLFDHIDQDGAFSRHSPVDIKTVIDVIKQNGGDESQQLMDVLQYTTKHFRDEETPKSIRSLFS